MDHELVQNLRAASSDIFRQRGQKFTTGSGQVKGQYEEIMHRMMKEISASDRIMAMSVADYGTTLREASGYLWNMRHMARSKRSHRRRSASIWSAVPLVHTCVRSCPRVMTGKAKEWFNLWTAGRHNTASTRSWEELLGC
jgi:hypothetical protein